MSATPHDRAPLPQETLELIKLEVGTLQEIIGRHEKHSFTVLALLVAVISGLGFLAFSVRVNITAREVWWMGGIAVFTFGAWALTHRALCGRAIERQRQIEDQIRNGTYTCVEASSWLAELPLETWLRALVYYTHIAPLIIAGLVVWQLGVLVDEKVPFLGANNGASDTVQERFRQHLTIQSRETAGPYRKEVTMTVVPETCSVEQTRAQFPRAEWTVVGSLKCQ